MAEEDIKDIAEPLLPKEDKKESQDHSVFKTTLHYYKSKLPPLDSKNPTIALTAKEWYGFHNYNSLRAGFFGGDSAALDTLFRKDKSHLDIIFSWLLIRNPGYLENIDATKGDPALLLAPASAPQSPEERKSAAHTTTGEVKPSSLFQIFLNIQEDMQKELKDILEKLTKKLLEPEEARQEDEKKSPIVSKFSLILADDLDPGVTEERIRSWLADYIEEKISLDQLMETEYFNKDLMRLHFLNHAKELYTRRKADSNASLKVLKKSINAYAREQEQVSHLQTPRLTKRPHYTDPKDIKNKDIKKTQLQEHIEQIKANSKKTDAYSVVLTDGPDTDPASNQKAYELEKHRKRLDKLENQAAARKRGWLYPILRCGAAVFGTCNVVSTIFDVPLIPTNPAQIFLMLSVALVIGWSTFYSNFGLGLTSIKTLKTTAKKLLWEPNPDPKKPFQWKPFFGRAAKSSLIVGTTAGVIAVYAVPLFNGIHKLASGTGLKHAGLDAGLTGPGLYTIDALGVAATLLMAWFVVEIFLPRISDFVHKFFKRDGSLTQFLEQELTAHMTGKTLKEKAKLFFNHSTPNFLRLGLVGACIGGSCYVIWGGLNSAIVDSFSLIPGFSNGSGLTMASYALVAFSFIGAFIFTYESMFASAKAVAHSPCTHSGIDDLTAELDHEARFQVNNKPPPLTGETSLQRPYPITVDDTYVKWANRGDFLLRMSAAAGSNFGTVGADVTPVSAVGGVAGTGVSFFNKLVGSKNPGLDRGSKNELPQSTYSTYLPLIAQNGIIVSETPDPDTSKSHTPPSRVSQSEAFQGGRSTNSTSTPPSSSTPPRAY